jgi:ABC-type transport system involved in multi-copper enzyme maturation permease subunit
MRPFVTIAVNAFMELVRQPIYLLLLSSSGAFIVFLAAVPYFGLGEDPKLVKDMSLAVTLLSGLLGAVLCASSSVAQEIRLGTALTVLAKPVSRAVFILGKYAGLAATLTLLTASNFVATMLASWMAFDAYGSADLLALGLYFGGGIAGYAVAGFLNFFLRRAFVADAVFGYTLATTLAAVYLVLFTQKQLPFGEMATPDWRLLPVAVLILFALFMLAALALACSTRLDTIPTLAVCTAFFALGLVSDYLFGRPANAGHWWAQVLYDLTPNWQQLYLAQALEDNGKVPWSYVAKAAGYAASVVVAALAAALVLFEDRELG